MGSSNHDHSVPSRCEIRDLGLLEDPGDLSDNYPFYGENLLGVVVDELERLREKRGIPILERIAQTLRSEGEAWDGVQDAITRIQRAVQGSDGERQPRPEAKGQRDET